MKRLLVLIATLASGFALSAAAQTLPAPAAPVAAPAGPAKIAVIAFQAAVFNTNEFQRKIADLQTKYAPKEAQLKTLGEEIDKLTKELQAQGDKLSETERANRAKIIDEKTTQAKRMFEDAQKDYQQELGELNSAISAKVYEVLANYVQQQGYTLVLDESPQQQQPIPVVLWSTPSTDITKAVIEDYNLKSGVPAPPPPPAATAKPASVKPPAHQ
ncbi:MAG: OmpH family outer membrane protein [Terracidiphilus sp.]|jgi:outer membrane protein